MVSGNFSMPNPQDAYQIYKNPKTNAVTVLYDDKNAHDEEMSYEFRADGSATATSLAWGTKTEKPAGTFSDVMLNLPKTEEMNKEFAQQLANIFYSRKVD